MNRPRFRRENLNNILSGFQSKTGADAGYAPAPPRGRFIRRSTAALAAVAALLFSLTVAAVAADFDPVAAWRRLFEKETSIEVGEQVVSNGISMDVQSLYTDGDRAVIKMTLKDLEGGRLSDDVMILSKDDTQYAGDYFAYVETASYDEETDETTCIVKLNFNRQYNEDEILRFAVDSILTGVSHTSEYQSFDFDLYEAAMSSDLRPTSSADAWNAAAKANPVPGIHLENTVRRGGVSFDPETLEFEPLNCLPLDTSAQGEKLCHWLSVTGVGYEDGVLHVQLRYDDLFGLNYHYVYSALLTLIDGGGNVMKYNEEIIYCGYTELQFEVGDIENIRELSLAWDGAYAENVIDGSWSFDINLDSVGDHISGSAELADHPDYTGISYTLSSMYLETKVDLHDLSITPRMHYDEETGKEYSIFFANDGDEKLIPGEISIILKDGTRLDLPVDSDNLFDRYRNHQNGKTFVRTQHWLDGSFEPGDVAELIIFGVSFTVA